MSTATATTRRCFDPRRIEVFRFTGRSLDLNGTVRFRYALDDAVEFEERFELPVPAAAAPVPEGLLDLLHWVAGVSYYKAAAPQRVALETGRPSSAAATLLEALYSEGLGEFAHVNRLPALPGPVFSEAGATDGLRARRAPARHRPAPLAPTSPVLVPIGGGKDSAVAVEVVRASGLPITLFSVGDGPALAGTVRVASLPRLTARRTLDPRLFELNRAGALNGHVPVTAIVSCVALLTASLHGHAAVAMANERSASSTSTFHAGVPINHQFSKSWRAERLLAAALAEIPGAPAYFSVLRPASELAIARRFASQPQYHDVFVSCNRGPSWCGDCPKCRFVRLILSPFLSPERRRAIFGTSDPPEHGDLLRAERPLECVGDLDDVQGALALLAGERDQALARALALSDEHAIPPPLIEAVHALLGA